MLLALSHLDSPVGRLVFAADEATLHALEFFESEDQLRGKLERSLPEARFENGGVPRFVVDALQAYFSGDVAALEGVRAEGAGTPFQRKVWTALRTVAPGRTTSYRAIAEAIGHPKAVRAVGAANGQNPIALVVPCHRVIAADGTLCGYGGGLWRKEWLLRHEGAILA
ncbi:MAG: methylated-DNA--[protein]-cysteine S-methyltransferase [Myxococcales bacterium]